MARRIRVFLLVEAATFLAAALAHSGVLVDGYEHPEARTAESVIALVLLLGLVLSSLRPKWTRSAGVASQVFALLGTLVGVFTIVIGVGPRTAPDIVYHVGILAVLAWGVIVAVRATGNDRTQQA